MNTAIQRNEKRTTHSILTLFKLISLSLILVLVGSTYAQAEEKKKAAKPNMIAAKSRISAPDFELDDLSGDLVVLSELKGKVVVIVFWATWCEPCKQEIPFLSKMRDKYKSQGFEVLTISTDNAQTQSRVDHYARKWNTRTMIDTDGEVKALLNPRGFAPYTLVIDRDGLIAFNYQGYQAGDEKMIEEIVKSLLSKKTN